ncbi:MAG: hypothetical protein EHM55_12050 [Acidobacteria bacterium]|nr:MAG: hypothetical protein EHM55_12050 [Acidobacteriota bacterium]
MTRALLALGLGLYLLGGLWVTLNAQRAGSFMGSAEDPAIRYSTAPLSNVVEEVNRKFQEGSVQLTFEGRGGFLRSALDALQIPIDSQLLVFSRDSLQGKLINEQSPRAIYFNDRVALGWVRDGQFIEVAVQDRSAGVVFYTLEQRSGPTYRAPQFMRATSCLGCHASGDTLGVPGLVMFSTTQPDPSMGSGFPRRVDHSEPLTRRFGGWFVTGSAVPTPHMGNDVAALKGRSGRPIASAEGLFDAEGYRTLSSDIVAHLVFAHQAGMTNLLTRASYEARAADPLLHAPFTSSPEEDARVASMMFGVASEVVDHLLFIDETRLPGQVRGGSGFAERFSAIGPRDRKDRSLYELDLSRRLMKYPCSYLIYSPAFDALPRGAKDPIYRRLWEVLSGQERSERYQSALSLADRRSIVEILRDTKKDLPDYFQNVTK